jgi:hypothetical protein
MKESLKMETESETEKLVMLLEKQLAHYYTSLDKVLPEVNLIEAETASVIEKLHDHLEQAVICQRYAKIQ